MPKGSKSHPIDEFLAQIRKKEMTVEESLKLGNLYVKWEAVKNKIVMDDQGSGFEGDD